jgi:ABC-type transport system involved in multi-copper enzyme maturation permease subunit
MFGPGQGTLLGVAVLTLEIAVPLAIATHVFRRRDW